MAKYIERDAAIEFIQKHMTEVNNRNTKDIVGSIVSDTYKMAIKHATDYLSFVPAADVAEVVRCKDCVFGKCIEDSGNYKCTTFNGRFGTVKPEDFCSYGERKRQNEN
jgi:hypothetical protein